MNDFMKKLGWILMGIAIGLFIASNIWLHYRITRVENSTAQIVNFLNQSQQKIQEAK